MTLLKRSQLAIILGVLVHASSEKAIGDDYPPELPFGGLKTSGPDGVRYIPPVSFPRADLQIRLGDKEQLKNAILKITMTTATTKYNQNLLALNDARQKAGKPQIVLVPQLTLRISLAIPGQRSPTAVLKVPVDSKANIVQLSLDQEQAKLVSSLGQQAQWKPTILTEIAISGQFRLIAIGQPEELQQSRLATARTLTINPPTGIPQDSLQVAVIQQEAEEPVFKVVKAEGTAFQGLQTVPSILKCEFSAVANFPNRLSIPYASWGTGPESTFTLPIRLLTVTYDESATSKMSPSVKKIMGLAFDRGGGCKPIYTPLSAANADRQFQLLVRKDTLLDEVLVVGSTAEGKVDSIRLWKVLGDDGSPTATVKDSEAIASIKEYVKKRVLLKVRRSLAPDRPGGEAWPNLDDLVKEKVSPEALLEPTFKLLDDGNRDDLVKCAAKFEELDLFALATKSDLGFLAEVIKFTELVSPQAMKEQAKFLANYLARSQTSPEVTSPTAQRILKRYAETVTQLIGRLYKAMPGGFSLSTHDPDVLSTAQTLQALFAIDSKLFSDIVETDRRYLTGTALLLRAQYSSAAKGMELVNKNVSVGDKTSMVIAAEVLFAGLGNGDPDYDAVLKICDNPAVRDTPACLRLKAMVLLRTKPSGGSDAEALNLLRQAADKGDPPAALEIARRLLPMSDQASMDQAVRYLTKIAATDTDAMAILGQLKIKSGDAQGRELIKRSSDQGNNNGRYLYATLLLADRPSSPKEALEILTTAALEGHLDSWRLLLQQRRAEVVDNLISLFPQLIDLDASARSLFAGQVAQRVYRQRGVQSLVTFLKSIPDRPTVEDAVDDLLFGQSSLRTVERALEDIAALEPFVGKNRGTYNFAKTSALISASKTADALEFAKSSEMTDFFLSMIVTQLIDKKNYRSAFDFISLSKDAQQKDMNLVRLAQSMGDAPDADLLAAIKNQMSPSAKANYLSSQLFQKYKTTQMTLTDFDAELKGFEKLDSSARARLSSAILPVAYDKKVDLNALKDLVKAAGAPAVGGLELVKKMVADKRLADAVEVINLLPKDQFQLSDQAKGYLAAAYSQNGDYDKALALGATLEKGRQLFSGAPTRADISEMVAAAQYANGKADDAMKTLDLMKTELGDEEAGQFRQQLALFCSPLAERGEVDAINALYKKYSPNDPNPGQLIIIALAVQKNYSSAEQLADKKPDIAHFSRLLIYSRQIDARDYAALAESVARHPTTLMQLDMFSPKMSARDLAYGSIVRALLEKQNFDEALRFASKTENQFQRSALFGDLTSYAATRRDNDAVLAVFTKLDQFLAGAAALQPTSEDQMNGQYERMKTASASQNYAAALDSLEQIMTIVQGLPKTETSIQNRIRLNDKAFDYLEAQQYGIDTIEDFIRALRTGP